MKIAAQAREGVEIVALPLGLGDERLKPFPVRRRSALGGKCRGLAFDSALRVHDLADGDAGELELDGERLGEELRIAARDPCAAARAHADVDDAQRRQRAQGVARDDPADAGALGDLLFAAKEVAGLEATGKERIPYLRHDLRRERRRPSTGATRLIP